MEVSSDRIRVSEMRQFFPYFWLNGLKPLIYYNRAQESNDQNTGYYSYLLK